jgi:LCP family protein required for cell wall assembly
MSLRWWKATSLLLVISLFITSCGSSIFAGDAGVQQAAQEALPKPPLTIAKDSSAPIPALNAEDYEPPQPPVRPFSVSAALFPQTAAANNLPDARLVGAAPDVAPTPLPVPAGPSFEWSKTDNYLVLGTDHRPGWTSWRTDVVIVVGVDRANNRLAVFSIPRDTYVQIPGYGWGRINQVDYMGERSSPNGGGPKLVSQVLQNTLGISTNHWVRVRMDGFIDVVNAVGGVTVHLDCPFYEPIFNLNTNAWDYFALPAGDVWMDGDTAYWFVRLRYRESDIGRNRRQRQFLWALRDQVTKTNLLAKFPDLYGAFQSTFTTDMSVFEMLDLMTWGTNLDAASVRAGGLSLSDLQSYTTAEGASVLRIGDPGRVRAVVEGIWNAPAMVDANRQDTTRCQPLPAGITFNTAENMPDLTAVDPDAAGAPAAVAENAAPPADATATPAPEQPAEQPTPEQPPAEQPAEQPTPEPAATEQPVAEQPEAPAAPVDAGLTLPTPTPAPQASLLLPTPTPGPVGLSDLPPVGGG